MVFNTLGGVQVKIVVKSSGRHIVCRVDTRAQTVFSLAVWVVVFPCKYAIAATLQTVIIHVPTTHYQSRSVCMVQRIIAPHWSQKFI